VPLGNWAEVDLASRQVFILAIGLKTGDRVLIGNEVIEL
jgi:hypothetical protein